MEDLRQVLQDSTLRSTRNYKVPPYNGEGDVDLFIAQFDDVSTANRWTEAEQRLNLRLTLTGKAMECGRGDSIEHILGNLRARFGLTSKQARDQLKCLRRAPHTSTHELGAEAEKLVNLAYPRLDQEDRQEMAIDSFAKAMENKALQRHLLARPPQNMMEAIQLTNEFLQVGGETRNRVAVLQDGLDHEDPIGMQSLVQTLQKLQETVTQQGQLLKEMRAPPRQTARRPISCYECQGPHFKRDCPKLQESRAKPTGNADGPTQPVTQLSQDLHQ